METFWVDGLRNRDPEMGYQRLDFWVCACFGCLVTGTIPPKEAWRSADNSRRDVQGDEVGKGQGSRDVFGVWIPL